MKGKKHRPEQIIRKLREADTMLAVGKTIARWFRCWSNKLPRGFRTH